MADEIPAEFRRQMHWSEWLADGRLSYRHIVRAHLRSPVLRIRDRAMSRQWYDGRWNSPGESVPGYNDAWMHRKFWNWKW